MKRQTYLFLITLTIAMSLIMIFYAVKENYSPILFLLAALSFIFLFFTIPIALVGALLIYFFPSKDKIKEKLSWVKNKVLLNR